MKKKKPPFPKRSLYYVASLIALAGACMLVTNQDSPPQSSVVSVLNRSGTSGGTGFVTRDVAGKHVIVTNDHVCEVAQGGYVVIVSDTGQGRIKRVLSRNFTRDLCVVEGIDAPALSIADSSPTRFEKLQVIGHPLLGPTTPSEGSYLQDDIVPIGFGTKPDGTCPESAESVDTFFGTFCVAHMELSLTSISIFPGNSGSPVLNREGKVVGVINSGDNRTTYGNFVPLRYLKEILGEKE